MNSPSATLKGSSDVWLLTLLGRRFHSRAALIPKELSYAVEYDLCAR